jgi:hypothetical protein
MDKGTKNQLALSEFIESNKLYNKTGIVRFSAVISMETKHNILHNEQVKIIVDIDTYRGKKLWFYDTKLNETNYPNCFYTQYQDFVNGNNYLLITGKYFKLDNYFDYNVKIFPFGVIEEPVTQNLHVFS